MRLYQQGSFMEFFQLWDEHLSEEVKREVNSQKLEFKLNVFFAVYPLLHQKRGSSGVGNQVSYCVKIIIVQYTHKVALANIVH